MNFNKAAMIIPTYDTDKILFTFRSNTSFNDLIGSQSVVLSLFPQATLAYAIYSYDNGVTWFDCADYGNPSGFNIQPPVTVVMLTDSTNGNITISKSQTALINGGNPYQLTCEVALVAPPGLTTVDTSTLSFANKASYRTPLNYLTIAQENTFVVNSGVATSTTIPHNQGYVPFVAVFINDITLGTNKIYPMTNLFGDFVLVDNNNLTITTTTRSGSPNLTIYYKIYKQQ